MVCALNLPWSRSPDRSYQAFHLLAASSLGLSLSKLHRLGRGSQKLHYLQDLMNQYVYQVPLLSSFEYSSKVTKPDASHVQLNYGIVVPPNKPQETRLPGPNGVLESSNIPGRQRASLGVKGMPLDIELYGGGEVENASPSSGMAATPAKIMPATSNISFHRH